MNKRNLTFAEAINEAQIQAMEISKDVFIFGQGVDKTALVFKTSQNIKEKFAVPRRTKIIDAVLNYDIEETI